MYIYQGDHYFGKVSKATKVSIRNKLMIHEIICLDKIINKVGRHLFQYSTQLIIAVEVAINFLKIAFTLMLCRVRFQKTEKMPRRGRHYFITHHYFPQMYSLYSSHIIIGNTIRKVCQIVRIRQIRQPKSLLDKIKFFFELTLS